MIDTNSERFRKAWYAFGEGCVPFRDDIARALTAWEASGQKADGATLAGLLASQEARDAAPCVAVNGHWYLDRGGSLRGSLRRRSFPSMTSWLATGHWRFDKSKDFGDCIWSGDLVAALSAQGELAEARRLVADLTACLSQVADEDDDGAQALIQRAALQKDTPE